MIVISAIIIDVVVLGGFIWVKVQTTLIVVLVSAGLIALTFFGERFFLKDRKEDDEDHQIGKSRN